MDEWNAGQATILGKPKPKTWQELSEDCQSAFGGGYDTDHERRIFHHGIRTVFNVVEDVLPPLAEVIAMKAELAAREERVVEVNIREGPQWLCTGTGLTQYGHCCCQHLQLEAGRYEVIVRGPLPDPPKPVAVWERPPGTNSLRKKHWMCSRCGTTLLLARLGANCPTCYSPLASTPSPWPGGCDG